MPDMQQETEEWVSFIEADGKFNQTHGDAFSNVWEYLHCLNCELYFNGVPRQRYTNNVKVLPRVYMLPDDQSVSTTEPRYGSSRWR